MDFFVRVCRQFQGFQCISTLEDIHFSTPCKKEKGKTKKCCERIYVLNISSLLFSMPSCDEIFPHWKHCCGQKLQQQQRQKATGFHFLIDLFFTFLAWNENLPHGAVRHIHKSRFFSINGAILSCICKLERVGKNVDRRGNNPENLNGTTDHFLKAFCRRPIKLKILK